MMQAFWRPVPVPGTTLKELWARCAICRQSGAFTWFEEWIRGEEFVYLCRGCVNDAHTRGHLLTEGWRHR